MYGSLNSLQGHTMKKLFLGLLITSSLVAQAAPQASVVNVDKVAKEIVACASVDLFPSLQEVAKGCRQEIKNLAKAALKEARFNKQDLKNVATMVKELAPLAIEGVKLHAPWVKKHGVMGVGLLRKGALFTVEKSNNQVDSVLDEQDEKVLGEVFASYASDDAIVNWIDKVEQFQLKWQEVFANYFEELDGVREKAAEASLEGEEVPVFNVKVITPVFELLANKAMVLTMNNKRIIKSSPLVTNAIALTSKQKTASELVSALSKHLEGTICPLVDSAELFAHFAVPFLADVITESIDEIIQTLPA